MENGNGLIKGTGITNILNIVEQCAPFPYPVVIIGETGVGKNRLARAIHNYSKRDPYVHCIIASLNPNLVEAELFGHAKGSFTGAVTSEAGFFRQAGKGTLFLDELDSLEDYVQRRLLGVLDTGVMYPVGSTKPVDVSCRIIAAVHKPLDNLVHDSSFRSDLRYRLGCVEIEIPPLRNRGYEAIAELANYFLVEQINQLRTTHQMTIPDLSYTDAALQKLGSYSWPGNVRQLEMVVKSAIVRSVKEGEIDSDAIKFPNDHFDFEDISAIDRLSRTSLGLHGYLQKVESELIEAALEQSNGNRSRAAQLLGVNRTAFFKKLTKFKKRECPKP